MISGFCQEVADNCTLLGYETVSSGNFLPMFRDNLSIPSSGVKNCLSWYSYRVCGALHQPNTEDRNTDV